MRRQRGFTLIEMMIVIAIITTIAAIAIPHLLRHRMQANEATAVEHLRVVTSAQVAYNASQLEYGDFAELTTEGGGPGTSYLDERWDQNPPEMSGYRYVIDLPTDNEFVCFAQPVAYQVTGVRTFRVDQTGVIRFTMDGSDPGPDATPLGGTGV